ncbi:MAG: hypothetical protein J0L56_08270 [Chitinophagales bacterium]|nr:hypothetical protein [Chitinophagales bacterium]
MTYEQYIENFKQFSERAIVNHKPTGNTSLEPGTISRVQSFISDLGDKIKGLNDVLVNEGNRILEEVDKDSSIDSKRLKDEIFELGKEAITEFVSRYKPR